jgi:hypothetical protein
MPQVIPPYAGCLVGWAGARSLTYGSPRPSTWCSRPWRVDPGVIREDDDVAAVGGYDRKRPVVFIDNWGLPRSTGSIEADRSAALLAQRTARTDAQRAAVALRLADIRAREVALTPAE